MRQGHSSVRCNGFTLIEIIVALAIVSIAILSIMNTMNTHAQVTSELEKRILSGWVASNVIAEVRHEAKFNKVRTGSRSQTVEMGGHRWRAKTKISETDVQNVFLLTVEVDGEDSTDDQPLVSLTTAVTESS